jgi:hypothetical protein
LRAIHVDAVVIVVSRIDLFVAGVALFEGEVFAPPEVVEVGEPKAIVGGDDSLSRGVDAGFGAIEGVMLRHDEAGDAAAEVHPEPGTVVLDEAEDFLVGKGVDVADDEEGFFPSDELGYVLAEEGEGGIGDDDV